ncbi:MAG: hypothetical protein IJ197_00360 [Bacteroidaceae bacterium]|nr:hypothetical protein [Bacteroidaceae bacterium]
MKKILLSMTAMLFAVSSFAQKTTTTYRYEDTQARALDMVAKGYVKPLTVEVKVDATKGRQHFSYDMAKDFVEIDMKGDVYNVRSYGLFKATDEAKCDIIVAPTFHLFTNEKGGYTLEIVGFAGNFINWRTMSNEDLQWINSTQVHTTGDRQQIDAVLKPTSNK